jgi:O-acetylhomoserine (thiol)-lyase
MTLGFNTLAIHAGTAPDPATGARQVPIYQTTAYVFRDADHAAKLFNLQEVGYIYSRLTNPTVSALANRVAALEGGAGAVCCSSGHAAQLMALFPLMQPGCNVVASTRLYGGTIQQFTNTIRKFGWSAKLVDFDDLKAIEAAIDENTRALFCETICNPGGAISDLDAIARVANHAGIPVIVDNTTATPFLCRPIEHGATIVVHSATKYLTGNGTGKFPSLAAPEPAYHGLNFHAALGAMAFTFHSTAVGLRDLGMTMNPQGAHYTLMGIETLPLRMERHVQNAQIVAEFLEADPRVEYVTYPGLKSSPYHHLAKMITPGGPGALFTFAIKGGYEAAVKLVDSVKLFSHVANLGDTRSLVIHSASTTHRQLSDEQRAAAGALPNVVRLSIGIEDVRDIIGDLDQALTKATA